MYKTESEKVVHCATPASCQAENTMSSESTDEDQNHSESSGKSVDEDLDLWCKEFGFNENIRNEVKIEIDDHLTPWNCLNGAILRLYLRTDFTDSETFLNDIGFKEEAILIIKGFIDSGEYSHYSLWNVIQLHLTQIQSTPLCKGQCPIENGGGFIPNVLYPFSQSPSMFLVGRKIKIGHFDNDDSLKNVLRDIEQKISAASNTGSSYFFHATTAEAAWEIMTTGIDVDRGRNVNLDFHENRGYFYTGDSLDMATNWMRKRMRDSGNCGGLLVYVVPSFRAWLKNFCGKDLDDDVDLWEKVVLFYRHISKRRGMDRSLMQSINPNITRQREIDYLYGPVATGFENGRSCDRKCEEGRRCDFRFSIVPRGNQLCIRSNSMAKEFDPFLTTMIVFKGSEGTEKRKEETKKEKRDHSQSGDRRKKRTKKLE